MAADVTVRPVAPGDVAVVAAAMRAADVAECALHGLTPREALDYCVAVTPDAATVLVAGVPAALYGATPTDGGATLAPWLLATPALERAPVAVARRARRQVAAWRARGVPMRNLCDTANGLAVGFLAWLGFTVATTGRRLALFSMEAV